MRRIFFLVSLLSYFLTIVSEEHEGTDGLFEPENEMNQDEQPLGEREFNEMDQNHDTIVTLDEVKTYFREVLTTVV